MQGEYFHDMVLKKLSLTAQDVLCLASSNEANNEHKCLGLLYGLDFISSTSPGPALP